MTVCPGFDAELRWVGLFQSRDRAMVCSHLIGAPNPARHSRVAACTHPESVWVVHSARRILDEGSVVASLAGRRAPLSLRDRTAAAQIRSALLLGRSRMNIMRSRIAIDLVQTGGAAPPVPSPAPRLLSRRLLPSRA